MAVGVPARAPGDAGESLLEVILSIALMGLAFTASLGAMQLGLIGSQVHRSHATAETVLLRAVEKLKAETAYTPCAVANDASYLPDAQSVASASGWDATTVSIPSVEYWNGAGFQSSGCSGLEAVATILRMQLITVQVTSPDGDAVESMSFVKRG